MSTKADVMDKGMLWYDDTLDKPIEDVIKEASAYFKKKYKATPNICYTPMIPRTKTVLGVKVVKVTFIQNNQYWIGKLDYDPDTAKR